MCFGAFTAGRCRGRSFSRRFEGLGVEAAESTYVVHAFDYVVLRANLAPQNTTRCLRWTRICGAFEGYGCGVGLATSTELCSQARCHGTLRIHSTSGKPQLTYCLLLCIYLQLPFAY
jgi:hypothetical protein